MGVLLRRVSPLSPTADLPLAASCPQVLSFLDSWCPSLEEAQLLRDAVKQLDELFLLVVLGEFNSGASCTCQLAVLLRR